MEHPTKDNDIEQLAIDLSVCLDKIKYIDELLKYCPNPEFFDKYADKFSVELDTMYDIKSRLIKLLSTRIQKEKTDNLPINMGYRLLYKELERF